MRGEEIRRGIDVYPVLDEDSEPTATPEEKDLPSGTRPLDTSNASKHAAATVSPTDSTERQSLGQSRQAAKLAVGETALSRVINATPVMVIPSLVLVRLQRAAWLVQRPRLVLPVNLGTFANGL